MLTSQDIYYAEEERDIEDAPEWQKENIKLAYEFIEGSSDSFIKLPGKDEIDEYRMMESFISNIEHDRIRNELWEAIEGKGAFGRFKDSVFEFGIRNDWFEYRDKCYREIAKEWCEINNIEYEEQED
ncbi:MAG: UPF0158 family protein [Bacillota bacterium]|nr:UPF0158 family protein [Bacillota bacterium]